LYSSIAQVVKRCANNRKIAIHRFGFRFGSTSIAALGKTFKLFSI